MKKNKIFSIFIIILLLSVGTSVIAATGVVNTDTVRVREEATTNSDIVALVSIGDKVTILGEENNWYKVKVKDQDGDTVNGYIRNDLLTVDGEVEPNTTNEGTEEQTEKPVSGEVIDELEGTDVMEEEPTEENTNQEPTGVTSNVTSGKADKTISTIKMTPGATVGTKIKLTEETKIKIVPSANSTNIAKIEANI